MEKILQLKYEIERQRELLGLLKQPAFGQDSEPINSTKERRRIEKKLAKLKSKMARIVPVIMLAVVLSGCASDGARRGGVSILCFDIHLQLGGVATRGNVPIEAQTATVTNSESNSAPINATLPLIK